MVKIEDVRDKKGNLDRYDELSTQIIGNAVKFP
jgi:hypothetical protein